MSARSQDGELARLADSAHATVEDGALLIARDAYPALDVARCRAELDALAAPVARAIAGGAPVGEQVRQLEQGLFQRAGFRGNDDDYYDPRNSYLNDVLDRKKGIPISLSVLVLAVCRRSGIVAEGVGFPGHFLVRIGGPSGVLIDPFDGGRPLDDDALGDLLKRSAGQNARLSASHVQPVGMRAIWIRMLTNLSRIHEQRSDHRSALVVCDRLVELDAGPPARRDRGLHALALGAGAAAASDLDSYLKSAPNAPDRADVERALSKASLGTSWN
jgi:regulator of sirC expression with transglutaminase-like and TPR domain